MDKLNPINSFVNPWLCEVSGELRTLSVRNWVLRQVGRQNPGKFQKFKKTAVQSIQVFCCI